MNYKETIKYYIYTMSFQKRIVFYLVHQLFYTNQKAKELIKNGQVMIDNKIINENIILTQDSEIKVNNLITRNRKTFVYLLFYKPKGYESTLNSSISNNLSVFFNNFNNLAIAGRLDKQSEGLLILSNDGKWIENLCNPKFEKEKEYDVILDKKPNQEFIKLFTSGVLIGKYITKTCQCKIIDDFSIRVILKEGKNRQIRKMCKTLGYSVLMLRRTRIHHFKLDSLNEGEYIKANVSSTFS